MGHALAESRSFVIRQLGKKYLRLGYRRIKFPPQPEDTTSRPTINEFTASVLSVRNISLGLLIHAAVGNRAGSGRPRTKRCGFLSKASLSTPARCSRRFSANPQ